MGGEGGASLVGWLAGWEGENACRLMDLWLATACMYVLRSLWERISWSLPPPPRDSPPPASISVNPFLSACFINFRFASIARLWTNSVYLMNLPLPACSRTFRSSSPRDRLFRVDFSKSAFCFYQSEHPPDHLSATTNNGLLRQTRVVSVFWGGEDSATGLLEDDQHRKEGDWLRNLRDDLHAGIFILYERINGNKDSVPGNSSPVSKADFKRRQNWQESHRVLVSSTQICAGKLSEIIKKFPMDLVQVIETAIFSLDNLPSIDNILDNLGRRHGKLELNNKFRCSYKIKIFNNNVCRAYYWSTFLECSICIVRKELTRLKNYNEEKIDILIMLYRELLRGIVSKIKVSSFEMHYVLKVSMSI